MSLAIEAKESNASAPDGQPKESFPAPELPTDRPLTNRRSWRSRAEILALPRPLLEALKRFSHREAITLFLTIMAAWIIQLAAKGLVQRARPVVEDAVAHAPGSSFPSGHATNTAAVALTLTLLVWPLLGRRGRVVVPLVAAACVILTAVDRVMLGVHYPSDVVAGIALGTALAGASYLGYSGWSVTPSDQEKSDAHLPAPL